MSGEAARSTNGSIRSRAIVGLTLAILLRSQSATGTLFSLNELERVSSHQNNGIKGDTCWQIAFADRVDCHPEINASEDTCTQRGCCWIPPPSSNGAKQLQFEVGSRQNLQGAPLCFFPTQYNRTYYVTSVTNNKFDTKAASESVQRQIHATLQLPQPTRFSSPDINTVALNVTYETPYRMRLTLNDAISNASRWQTPFPPLQKASLVSTSGASPMYTFDMSENGSLFGFRVNRASDNAVIFDATNIGAPLVFTDQLLMLSARLPGIQAVYGLGEHWGGLNRVGGRYTFFATDAPPMPEGKPGYGAVPFFIGIGSSGDNEMLAYGVYLHSSNFMEVEITEEGIITYRITGGIFDFYFFFGPTPEEVVRQFTELIGRPQMPPYWSLGYHLSRWGLTNVSETNRIFQRNVDAGIPLQTMWNDIDYMIGKQDFTYDPVAFANLSGFVQSLHDSGRNYVPIVDVGIPNFLPSGSYPPYDEGTVDNVWVKAPNADAPLVGKVWPGDTVYPDFTHPNATAWWSRQIVRFHSQVGIDGMWIDMNEPSNFYDGSNAGCPSLADGNNLDFPPFQPPLSTSSLFAHTICMSSRQYVSTHYNLHNVYAYTEAVATHAGLLEVSGGKKRPFIVSRSNAAGLGTVSAHWSGDVSSTYYDMQRSIAHALSYNMFGIPMVGSDICGFNGNTNEELCLRWHQLGAFYPFSRNHNSINMVDQDPAAWSPQTQAAIRAALNTRYQLLPHFYTMFAYAAEHGGTVVRPLSFEFPYDVTTYSLDWQFLIGSSVMIIPVLEEGARTVTAYFPLSKNNNASDASGEVWYDFYTGGVMASKAGGGSPAGVYKQLAAPLDTINIALRGGDIVPLQHDAMTVTEARRNAFYLYVALAEDSNVNASGTLYWDSGDDYNVMTTGEFNLIRFAAGLRPRAEKQHDLLVKVLTGKTYDDAREGQELQQDETCARENAVGWLTSTPQIYNFTQEDPMILGQLRFSGIKPELQPATGSNMYVLNLNSTSNNPIGFGTWTYTDVHQTLMVSLDENMIVSLDVPWVVYWC